MDTFEEKTAVITGAGSGMGRAMALRLAEAGSRIVLADVDDEAMAAVVAEIEASGGKALAVHTDVSDAEANDELFARSIEAFGQVNVVCLNAGVTGSVGRSWTLSEQDWNWTLGILLNGVVNGVRSFVPHLVEHGDGHVVLTASIAGHVSAAYSSPYMVAKHGVATLAESLYHELKFDGSTVGVTCLCPGFVNTNIVSAAVSRDDGDVGTNVDDAGAKWLKTSGRMLETGLDPSVVGQQVHDAILANQFWLFTDEEWDDAIALRAEEVTNRLPPTIGRLRRQ